MQYKLRVLVNRPEGVIEGITIPHNIAVFFKETFFNVEKSGNQIILTSGQCLINPSKEEIRRYDFSDLQ